MKTIWIKDNLTGNSKIYRYKYKMVQHLLSLALYLQQWNQELEAEDLYLEALIPQKKVHTKHSDDNHFYTINT